MKKYKINIAIYTIRLRNVELVYTYKYLSGIDKLSKISIHFNLERFYTSIQEYYK